MHVDVTRYPLIVVAFSPRGTDAEIAEAVERTAAVFARAGRVAFVVDLDFSISSFGAERRAKLRDLMAGIQREADRWMVGVAYVAKTPVTKGIVVALNWARGARPYPIRVMSTRDEALAVATGWLQQEGLIDGPADGPKKG